MIDMIISVNKQNIENWNGKTILLSLFFFCTSNTFCGDLTLLFEMISTVNLKKKFGFSGLLKLKSA